MANNSSDNLSIFLTFIAFSALALTVPSTGIPASFDCGKAGTMTEKLICATPEISDLDERLQIAYKNSLNRPENKIATRNDQREWISNVRNKCHDANCLKSAYSLRISSLSKKVESSTAQCKVEEDQIMGNWGELDTADFEEILLRLEEGKRFFISWRHHHTESVGTWELKGCTLYIKNAASGDLGHTYEVLKADKKVLRLSNSENGESSSYSRIKR